MWGSWCPSRPQVSVWARLPGGEQILTKKDKTKKRLQQLGLEPRIFCSVGRRLIHWAIAATEVAESETVRIMGTNASQRRPGSTMATSRLSGRQRNEIFRHRGQQKRRAGVSVARQGRDQKSKMITATGTRTQNLLLRRQTPYPLGHSCDRSR